MDHTSSLSIWEAEGLPQFLCHTELRGETQKPKIKQTAAKRRFYLNFSGVLMQQNYFLASKG